MREDARIGKTLTHMAFLQREVGFVHHGYDEELRQFEMLRAGDLRAVEESASLFNSDRLGHLSDDPMRNKRYHFVVATTIATRFAMAGGLSHEIAYMLSDLFIQRMDACKTQEEIAELHRLMFTEFTTRVALQKQCRVYSKPVLLAMDYIYTHLQQSISVAEIAEHVNLSRSYLSVLFQKETGVGLSAYIRDKRIEAAENMLKYSDFSLQEIADYLAFNSQSHFISVFKDHTGKTPGAYRKENCGVRWIANSTQELKE